MKDESSDARWSHERRPRSAVNAKVRDLKMAGNDNAEPQNASAKARVAELDQETGGEIVVAVLALAMLGTALPYLLT